MAKKEPFESSDVIRFYQRYLGVVGRAEARDSICFGGNQITPETIGHLKETIALWRDDYGVDSVVWILEILYDELQELNALLGTTGLLETREQIQDELRAYDAFLEDVPDFLKPIIETVLLPIKTSMEFIVRLLTPVYVLREAMEYAWETKNVMEEIDWHVSNWENNIG